MIDWEYDQVHSTPNEAAIRQWSTMPRDDIEAYDDEGDFAKRHLLNSVLLRMLGPLPGTRILDAGSGEGYFSRLLADQGAHVVAVEPASALLDRARELESVRQQGIDFVQADLAELPTWAGRSGFSPCHSILAAYVERNTTVCPSRTNRTGSTAGNASLV